MATYLFIWQKLFYTCWIRNKGEDVQPIVWLINLFALYVFMTTIRNLSHQKERHRKTVIILIIITNSVHMSRWKKWKKINRCCFLQNASYAHLIHSTVKLDWGMYRNDWVQPQLNVPNLFNNNIKYNFGFDWHSMCTLR